MTITFEAIGGESGTASATGGVHLAPRVRGREVPLSPLYGSGGVSVPVRITSAPRGGIAPPLPAIGSGGVSAYVAPYGTAYAPGDVGGGARLQVRVRGRRSIAAGDAVGQIQVAPRVVGSESAPPPPPLGYDLALVYSTIDFFNVPTGRDIAGLIASIGARTSRTARINAKSSARSSVKLAQTLSVVWRYLAVEGFQIGAAPVLNFTAVQRTIDLLRMSGACSSTLAAVNLVVSAIATRMTTDALALLVANDGVSFDSVMSQSLRYASRVVDELLAAAAGDHVLHMAAVVSESLVVDEAMAGALDARALVREAVALALRLDYDGDQQVAYVINTTTKAVTTYQNYPFNSFAKIGGSYYGMSPDGIRELEGKTDDGAPINWRMRTAMTNLGTSAEKRMQSAYLGYCSNGAVRLQVIVSDPKSGKKEAHYYRLDSQPAESPQQARLKIGQGLKTVYWAFGLQAIDGAEFQADLLELYPIVLETRMQGQNGGRK